MGWRTKRRADTAEQALASAIVARVSGERGSAAAAEVAVRAALARAEVDAPIARIVVISVGNAPFARVLGAALGRDREVAVVALGDEGAGDADGAFLVLPSSTPPQDASAARDSVAPTLLGVVVADDAGPPPRDAEAERLAGLTNREAAVGRMTEEVERQRAELDERERAVAERRAAHEEAPAPEEDARATGLEAREQAVAERERELVARERVLEERAAAAAERAEAAERALAERDEEVARLRGELEEALREPEPEPRPDPGTPGGYNLRDLEEQVHAAQLRNDPRAEELAYYIPLFREHAALDGSLPAHFDALVESVFV